MAGRYSAAHYNYLSPKSIFSKELLTTRRIGSCRLSSLTTRFDEQELKKRLAVSEYRQPLGHALGLCSKTSTEMLLS
jgi:hypothetical protein